MAADFKGQLDLTVMIALVPDHVLEKEDGVIVVKLHVLAFFDLALHRVAHRFGALIQPLRDAIGITLGKPLGFGQGSSKFRCVFGEKHEPDVVDVGEHFGDGWTVSHRSGFQSAFRESAEQVDQDCIVAIPRVEQNLKQALICNLRHGSHQSGWMTGQVLSQATERNSTLIAGGGVVPHSPVCSRLAREEDRA